MLRDLEGINLKLEEIPMSCSEPVYVGYPTTYPSTSYPVSNDPDAHLQFFISTLQQDGERIKSEGQLYNGRVKCLREQVAALPEITEEKPPIVEETPSRNEPIISGDSVSFGLKVVAGMAAVLGVAAIMRKYPDTFAIPTLEGNVSVGHNGWAYRHQW